MEMLQNAFIKPVSEIYNRHSLITCKQDPHQPIDNFMQNLERIAKTCNFQAVTAIENKNQYVREAFINGLNSSIIR